MHNYSRERSTRKGDCAQTETQMEETCTKRGQTSYLCTFTRTSADMAPTGRLYLFFLSRNVQVYNHKTIQPTVGAQGVSCPSAAICNMFSFVEQTPQDFHVRGVFSVTRLTFLRSFPVPLSSCRNTTKSSRSSCICSF